MNDRQARAVHMADQAIAEITAKLDGYRDQAAAALPTLGYEATVTNMHQFLVGAVRKEPNAVAALAAVAIVRLARDGEAGA